MGAVWDRTTKFLRANSGAVLTISALAIFLPTVVSGVVQAAMVGDDPTAMGAAGFVVSLIASIVTLIGQIALVALAIDATLGTNGAFSVAGRRLLPVIGVSLLLTLMFVILLLPLFIVLGASIDFSALQAGDTSSMPELSASTGWFVGLYMLALFPVFLWLAARFSVLLPVIVWEKLGIGAIGRSFRLTRGYALKIVGIFILFGVVALVALMAFGGVFGAFFAMTAGGIQGFTVGAVLMTIVTGLLTVVFTVLYTVFLTKLYKSLIEETEPAAVFE